MDLIGCPRCNERFLLRDSEGGEWPCPNCRAALQVVAHRIPEGIVTPDPSAFNNLQQVGRSFSGTPFQSR